MKKLLYLLIAICCIECSKNTNPTPTPVPLTCATSTYKYEVILATPVKAGTFQIGYTDEFGNAKTDTTITTSWTKSFVPSYAGNFGIYDFEIDFSIGPLTIRNSFINGSPNVTNAIIVNIYKNGSIVQTTGTTPLPYCYGMNPQCNTNGTIIKSEMCQ